MAPPLQVRSVIIFGGFALRRFHFSAKIGQDFDKQYELGQPEHTWIHHPNTESRDPLPVEGFEELKELRGMTPTQHCMTCQTKVIHKI